MKQIILLFAAVLYCLSVRAQCDPVPPADQEILARIGYLTALPDGTHKIYNGRGSSVFDVLYTIEKNPGKATVYKGGTMSYFDILYTIESDDDGCRVFRGSSNSVFNQIYTILRTDSGYEIYRGRSTFMSDLLYSYER